MEHSERTVGGVTLPEILQQKGFLATINDALNKTWGPSCNKLKEESQFEHGGGVYVKIVDGQPAFAYKGPKKGDKQGVILREFIAGTQVPAGFSPIAVYHTHTSPGTVSRCVPSTTGSSNDIDTGRTEYGAYFYLVVTGKKKPVKSVDPKGKYELVLETDRYFIWQVLPAQ